MTESKTRTRMAGKARREQILDVACRLFAEFGYDFVSTKQLAAELNCSEPLIFNYFPSKEAIYEALFGEWKQYQQEAAIIPIINHSAIDSLGALYDAMVNDSWDRPTHTKFRPQLSRAIMGRPSYLQQCNEVIASASDIVTASILPVIRFGRSNHEITSSLDDETLGQVFWTLTVGSSYIYRTLSGGSIPNKLPFEKVRIIFA